MNASPYLVDWIDLDGKTLRIAVALDPESGYQGRKTAVLCGVDTETGVMYVLKEVEVQGPEEDNA